jgi:hypothetical protein
MASIGIFNESSSSHLVLSSEPARLHHRHFQRAVSSTTVRSGEAVASPFDVLGRTQNLRLAVGQDDPREVLTPPRAQGGGSR